MSTITPDFVVPSPSQRMPALVAERRRKMAASAHAYVRGSTARFYEWLQSSDRLVIPEGPTVWIGGDCHVGNLGPIASKDGELEIQIRDLDQTVIGNPAHDLARLSLSLAMAARGSDLPGVVTALMLEAMMEGYESAFTSAPDSADQQAEVGPDMPKTVRRLMKAAAGRSWRHLADERIEGSKRTIPLGDRFWPISDEERAAIEGLAKTERFRRLATSLRSRDDDAPVRMLDAAFWKKGCSSLGRLRYALLVAVGEGKAERHCLIDIKEATTAAAPHTSDALMPEDNAERVVTAAMHLAPFLGPRMQAASLLDKSVVLRELLPQDLKLELSMLTADEAVRVANFLANVVGQAHARQMDRSQREQWLAELQRNRSKNLDAPSWLWDSLVELVAAHEAAYLQHCRRYALT